MRSTRGSLIVEVADLNPVGFSGDELSALLPGYNVGFSDPDEIPETLAAPVTVLGETWVLGRHRLTCGDSTVTETVAKALGGTSPGLVVTDPPYGVNYDPIWRNRAGVSKSKRVAKSKTTTGPTGARYGHCSPGTSPTSGTEPCTQRPWPRA